MATTLIEALEKVTQNDLKEIDTEIETQEKRLSALKKARTVVATRLGVREEKKPGPRKKDDPKPDAAAALEMKRRRIATELLKGSMNGHEVMNRCGVGGPQLAEVMAHPWFVKTPTGYHLTTEGRRAVG
jgi:hypothetical protein